MAPPAQVVLRWPISDLAGQLYGVGATVRCGANYGTQPILRISSVAIRDRLSIFPPKQAIFFIPRIVHSPTCVLRYKALPSGWDLCCFARDGRMSFSACACALGPWTLGRTACPCRLIHRGRHGLCIEDLNLAALRKPSSAAGDARTDSTHTEPMGDLRPGRRSVLNSGGIN